MKIKVCGLREPADVEALSRLAVDYLGFIFFEGSARYVGTIGEEMFSQIPPSIKKVGVFVDAPFDEALSRVRRYGLEAAQLHGNESPEYCRSLKSAGLEVIKAFSIAGAEDLLPVSDYEPVVDFLLFDTRTPLYGGSGRQFDWSVLDHYTGSTPFFLSGGISLDDASRILELKHPSLYAADLNSRFETAPGKKDVNLVQQFINQIKQHDHE